MESSPDFNFMSMDGLPFEDQAKLQSMLFGAEEKVDGAAAESNGVSEERRHVFNVHAQVFVPRVFQPVVPEMQVPHTHSNHVYGIQPSIQNMPDPRALLNHNPQLRQNNMHMFNAHHDLPPEFLPLANPHIVNQQLQQQQQQHQQQLLQQSHMHHNHVTHMQQQQQQQQQSQQYRGHMQLQQQSQQPVQHIPQAHQPPPPPPPRESFYQKPYNNNNDYAARNYNGNPLTYKQEMPPRYQRKNYDRPQEQDGRNFRYNNHNNKRITVLQNPNSRRHQGHDARLGPRFYRQNNGDPRRYDEFGAEYRREYARKIEEDINSNMLKLQNGLEPKCDGSGPSDASDDERIVLSLNRGAVSPSSVKWPSEMSSTGSPVSRSLSPASSYASGVTSPPQTQVTENKKYQSENKQLAEAKRELPVEEVCVSKNTGNTDHIAHGPVVEAVQREVIKAPEYVSPERRAGVEIREQDTEWSQDVSSNDPNDEWSSIAPETPWSPGFDQHSRQRNEFSDKSGSIAGPGSRGPAPRSPRNEEKDNLYNDQSSKLIANEVQGSAPHSQEVGSEKPRVNNDNLINDATVSKPMFDQSKSPVSSTSNDVRKGSPVPVQAGGGVKTDTSRAERMGAEKPSDTASVPPVPSGSDQSQANTASTTAAAPDTKLPPPPGPPVSQPPKPPLKSWAALVRHNLPADSQPALVISDHEPRSSVINKQAVNLKVETIDDQESCDPGSDKLIRKLREYIGSTSLHHRPPSVFPRGLINRANWCYVNATLQALLACPPFYHIFRNMPRMKMKDRGPTCTPVMDSIVEFINEFNFMKPLFNRSKKQELPSIQTEEPFTPDYVYSMLMKLKSTEAFKQGRQEDAEEFLTCVLNHIHEEMVAVVGSGNKVNGVENNVKPDDAGTDEASDDWEQVGRKKKAVITRSNEMPRSLVTDIFCGQIRSILRSSGARESATLEPFFTLPLDIQHEKVCSVRDALAGLVSKESIHGFTCSKTKEEVEATRCTMFELLPPVLVLHLKCFIYDTNGGCQKLNKEIEYTVDLEISKDIISPNARMKIRDHQRSYKLFAVVYHRGKTLQGGHYTTDVYHSGINGWIRIDDHTISVVPVSHVLRYEQHYMPYLLYYRRHDSLGQDRGGGKS